MTEDGGRKTDDGRPTQVYKFQRLEIYQLALTYIDLTYDLAAMPQTLNSTRAGKSARSFSPKSNR